MEQKSLQKFKLNNVNCIKLSTGMCKDWNKRFSCNSATSQIVVLNFFLQESPKDINNKYKWSDKSIHKLDLRLILYLLGLYRRLISTIIYPVKKIALPESFLTKTLLRFSWEKIPSDRL